MSEVKDKDRGILTTTRNEVLCQDCGTKNKKQNLTDFLISLEQRKCDSCGFKLSPRYDAMFKDIIIIVGISSFVFAIGAATFFLTTVKIPEEVFLGLLQLISILLGAQTIVVFYYYSRIDQQRTAYLDSYHVIFSRFSELRSSYSGLMKATRDLKDDHSKKAPIRNRDNDSDDEEEFSSLKSGFSDLRNTMIRDFTSVQHSIRVWITTTVLSYASAIIFSVLSLILIENGSTQLIIWFLCSITASIIIAFVSFEEVWSEKETIVKRLLGVTEKQNDMIHGLEELIWKTRASQTRLNSLDALQTRLNNLDKILGKTKLDTNPVQ